MPSQVKQQYKNIGIMLIDDEASVCAGHKYVLRYQYGFNNISVYTNPVEALKALEDCSDQIDIILLDLRMPDIDGLTMLARIKEINPALQIIILSVLVKDEDIFNALQETQLVYQLKQQEGKAKKSAILTKGDKEDKQRLAGIICEAYDYKRNLNATVT